MIYAISDIHGYLDALRMALDRIGLAGDDRLILLGDYIDYGPKSGETLRYLYELQKQYGAEKVAVLRGNHEDALLEWLDTYSGPYTGEPDESGMVPWNDWLVHDEGFRTFRTLVTPKQWAFFTQVGPSLSEASLNVEAVQMVRFRGKDLIAWLRGLPYFHETDRQIFVHAGIDEESGDWWLWATPEETFTGKYPPSTGAFYKDIIAGHVGTSQLAGDPAYHGVYFDGQSHYYIDGSIHRQGGRLNILAWEEASGTYLQWDDGWREVSILK